MTNTEILNEYFIWEENNSIEPKMKSENKTESEPNDSTKNIKIVNEQENWQTITDPKLREKMYKKAWYEANKDKAKLRNKAWREANRDTIFLRKKAYRESNKEKERLRKKAWYEANRQTSAEYKKQWAFKNREKLNRKQRDKRKNDIQFKIRCSLRKRLSAALANNRKLCSAVKDLGCTIDELKTYLESKFQSGMTWDNYGLYGWHIDHIKPFASFDLTDRKQVLEACHYTNLQPLWATDNLSKGSRTGAF